MKLPATDDLLLFGSAALIAIGAALTTGTTSGDPLLGFGVALIVFGVPTMILVFMAASAEETK